MQHYLDMRDDLIRLKNKIKAKFYRAGVLRISGTCIYRKSHRAQYLDQLTNSARRAIVTHLYALLDATTAAREKARADMIRLGRAYAEIQEFMKMPGVGPVTAHVFDAFIQTPHRFATKQKLWRYCKLGIVDRNSAGKPLAYKRLDRAGNSELKAASYRAFLVACRRHAPNEVARFYEASCLRTGHTTRARLNTQRKILAVLWTIWKKNVAYNPELFYQETPTPAEAAVATHA